VWASVLDGWARAVAGRGRPWDLHAFCPLLARGSFRSSLGFLRAIFALIGGPLTTDLDNNF
jgi:hypothetical protein